MSKTKKWLILLVATALAFTVAVAMGQPIKFLTIYVLTAVVFSIVIRKSVRSQQQDKDRRLEDPEPTEGVAREERSAIGT